MVAAERIMAMLFAGDYVVQVVRGSPDPAPPLTEGLPDELKRRSPLLPPIQSTNLHITVLSSVRHEIPR